VEEGWGGLDSLPLDSLSEAQWGSWTRVSDMHMLHVFHPRFARPPAGYQLSRGELTSYIECVGRHLHVRGAKGVRRGQQIYIYIIYTYIYLSIYRERETEKERGVGGEGRRGWGS